MGAGECECGGSVCVCEGECVQVGVCQGVYDERVWGGVCVRGSF